MGLNSVIKADEKLKKRVQRQKQLLKAVSDEDDITENDVIHMAMDRAGPLVQEEDVEEHPIGGDIFK